jgi:hypothetical protein
LVFLLSGGKCRRALAFFLSPFLVLLLLLWHSWFGPDIWYHLSWGRSLLERGSFMPETHTLLAQPIVANGYWLFQVTVASLMAAGGVYAVSALFLLMWVAIAILWIRETGALRDRVFGAGLFLAFIVCAQTRFEARPEVFSYLFLIAEIAWLRRAYSPGRISSVAALFAIQVLWTNSHGYFVLGPLLAGAWLVANLLESGKPNSAAVKNGALIFAAVLAASFVSPFPLGMWESVWGYVGVSRALHELNAELQAPVLYPVFWPFAVFWILWAVAALTSLWNLFRRREDFASILALAGCILAVQASRNIPLFLLLSAPVFRFVLTGLHERKMPRGAGLVPVTLALLLGVCVVRGDYHKSVTSLGTFGVRLEPSAYPIAAAEFLVAEGFKGKLFCDSYDGGYLEYRLPEIQVAGDSYFSDGPLTLKYFAAIRDPQALKAMNGEFHFDGLLINVENIDVIEALWKDPDWDMVYRDSHRAFFSKETNASVRGKFYNGEDLSHWTNAFGVMTWSGLALKYRKPELMAAILRDLKDSPGIPAPILRYAIILSGEIKNRQMFEDALILRPKSFDDSGVSNADVDTLIARAKAFF